LQWALLLPTETSLTLDRLDRQARREGLILPLPIATEGMTNGELQELHVELSVIHGLWERSVRVLGDPSFPLRCAVYPPEDARSPVMYACISRPSVAAGFEAMIRYAAAVSDDLRWSWECRGQEIVISAAPAGPSLGARCAHEFHVADLIRAARRVTHGSWAPREVRFSHRALARPAHYDDVLGVPVRFGADRVEIAMARASLEVPIAERMPAHVAAFFESWADAILARRTRRPSLEERVRAALEGEIGGGDPSLGRIARRLAMSERSLHRHLAASGTSFRRLLDDTRRDRALELLDDEGASVLAVASSLGFSDGRAFARAFKRWTGRSPRSEAPV
jgi:AraC-like DNA-binding protein